jgi:hypothetical protein
MNKTTKQTQLTKAIMRRIWYVYTISIVLSRNTAWGFLFGASMIGFWKLVSVTSIINNFLSIRVGDVPAYSYHAIVQAHFLALLAFGIIVFTVLSVGVKSTFPKYSHSRNNSLQSA